MTLTFKMKTAYLGNLSNAGPFDIYAAVAGETVPTLLTNGVVTATGITKNTLDAGYSITNVSDYITGGTINSTGGCDIIKDWIAPGQPPLPYSRQEVIGYSPVGAIQAENSVPLDPTQYVYMRVSDGLYFNSSALTVLINGWYVLLGEEGMAPRHFINGVEQQ